MIRFAILKHTERPISEDHYDIVLEKFPGVDIKDGALVKFETISDFTESSIKIKYMGMIDKKYLQYEGLVSGDRGRVERVDEGEYNYSGDHEIEFKGNLLNGIYSFCGEDESMADVLKSTLLCKKN